MASSSVEAILPIQIDDYEFLISGKYSDIYGKDNANYTFYEIQSKRIGSDEEPYIFYVYNSNSELGVLRFTYFELGGKLAKGEDYYSTTTIHPKLIKYVYDNQHRFELIPVNMTKKIPQERQSEPEKAVITNNVLYREYLDLPDRKFWNNIRRCRKECAMGPNKFMEELFIQRNDNQEKYRISDEDGFKPETQQISTGFSLAPPPMKKSIGLSVALPSPKKPMGLSLAPPPTKAEASVVVLGESEEISVGSQYLSKVRQYGLYSPYLKYLLKYYLEHPSETPTITTILNGMSDLISKLLSVNNDTIEIIGSYKNVIVHRSDFSINPNFFLYRVELNPIDSSDDLPKLTDNYYLYYIVFKINDEIFRQPILLTPKSAKITKFGVFDKYHPVGIYIGKPYDYEDSRGMTTKYRLQYDVKSYSFFSHHYQDIYPLNSAGVKEKMMPDFEQSGGSYYQKYLKYKMKYLALKN